MFVLCVRWEGSGERAKRGEARDREQERSNEMDARQQRAGHVISAHEMLAHFRRERRERRQSAQKSRDDEKTPLGRDIDARNKERDKKADKVTADQIRRERAERISGRAGI